MTAGELKGFLSTKELKALVWHKRAGKASALQASGKWSPTKGGWRDLEAKYKNYGNIVGRDRLNKHLAGSAMKGAVAGNVAKPFLKRFAGGGLASGAADAAQKYGIPVVGGLMVGGSVGNAVFRRKPVERAVG